MANVFIEAISIDGYRSCTGTVLTPNKSLSGLIGINGAGKTNILNALRLLNPSLYADSRLFRSGKEDTKLPATILNTTFRIGAKRLMFRLVLTIASTKGEEEVVSATEYWNFSEFGRPNSWVQIPLYFTVEGSSKSNALRYMYMLEESKRKSSSDNELEEILSNKTLNRVLRQAVEYRQRIKYYSASQFTDPTRCPSSFEINGAGDLEVTYYTRNSQHLQFLFDLYSLKKNSPLLYKEYEEFVSTKMLGLVSRISWKPVKLSSNTVEMKTGGTIKKVRQYKTLVIPKVQIGSSHITFNQLSEGTFKTLALIFYIMTDNSLCLLIEEPEVCIHHGLLRRILGIIKAHANTKQVIFTTHSDLVLDSIPTDSVFVVDMKRSVTRVNRLADWAGKDAMNALHAYLQETGTLGEYWRSGGFM